MGECGAGTLRVRKWGVWEAAARGKGELSPSGSSRSGRPSMGVRKVTMGPGGLAMCQVRATRRYWSIEKRYNLIG